MNCPHCASDTTKEQTQKTTLGYRTFRCSACKHLFNERIGTSFNFLEYPTDVVLLVVLWRLRYKLSLRDLAEMFLERGLAFTLRDGSGVGNTICSTHCKAIAGQTTRTTRRNHGTWMKPTYGSRGNGVIFIAPLMQMATWLIRV